MLAAAKERPCHSHAEPPASESVAVVPATIWEPEQPAQPLGTQGTPAAPDQTRADAAQEPPHVTSGRLETPRANLLATFSPGLEASAPPGLAADLAAPRAIDAENLRLARRGVELREQADRVQADRVQADRVQADRVQADRAAGVTAPRKAAAPASAAIIAVRLHTPTAGVPLAPRRCPPPPPPRAPRPALPHATIGHSQP